MNLALLCGQVLLTFVCEGEGPVRFGFPLPAASLARGLRLSDGDAALQWRRLHTRPDPHTGRLWVELAVVGAQGRVSVLAGGKGAVPAVGEDGGDVVAVSVEADAGQGFERFAPTEVSNAGESAEGRTGDGANDPGTDIRRTRWRWRTGEVDVAERRVFIGPTEFRDEVFLSGEAWTERSGACDSRYLRVRIPARAWVAAGVLPRMGRLATPTRQRLADLVAGMRRTPGLRGRGDYMRSGEVVTNLEFDTALGFLRLGLALERMDLVQRGVEAARHLVDRDIHPVQGLPFRHGKGHRSVPPELGHVWLTGVLLAGCLSADDVLIRAAGTMAHGIARHPPRGQGRRERARDYGWPLLELEAWLRFAESPKLVLAADHFAQQILRRWDARNRVVRFGEGERSRGFYEERAWVTGGILVPALRKHMERRPSREVAGVVESIERRLLGLVLQGRPGLPVRYWVIDGKVTGQVRLTGVPEGYMLMEGIAPRALARCLGRQAVPRALHAAPAADDPDLATGFSIAARCSWVLR